jgi:hypothetical protein
MEGTYDNKKATLELGTQPIGKLLWRYAMPGDHRHGSLLAL